MSGGAADSETEVADGCTETVEASTTGCLAFLFFVALVRRVAGQTTVS